MSWLWSWQDPAAIAVALALALLALRLRRGARSGCASCPMHDAHPRFPSRRPDDA